MNKQFIKSNLVFFIILVVSLVATFVSLYSLLNSVLAVNGTLMKVSLLSLFLSALVAIIATALIEAKRLEQ